MREKTHYQVLGVRPEASVSVIEAAYQRLLRQHHTEAKLSQQPLVGNDPALARLQEAYQVLRDPTRRQQYDESLRLRRGDIESIELSQRAQQQLAESGAWLSEQRHSDDKVIFRIGWAADFTAVRRALEEAIPPFARHYDADQGVWTVDLAHAAILEQLFDNYTPPHRPPPPRIYTPVYQPKPYQPSRQRIRELWQGWPFLIMAVLALAIVLTLLLPSAEEQQLMVASTATAVALAELAQQATVAPSPPPAAAELALGLLPVTLQYASVHLRSGPGTDTDSLGFLNPTDSMWAAGRTADSSWLVIVSPLGTGWTAAWTVEVEGNLSGLPVYAADDLLPEIILPPTLEPSPSAGTPSSG